jgi:hypothetical protein
MQTIRPPRWPYRTVQTLALASGLLLGAGGAWVALPLGGWASWGMRIRFIAAGAVCGLFAAALWCLGMMPKRRAAWHPPDREQPWLVFWGMFWGFVAWLLAAMLFLVWALLSQEPEYSMGRILVYSVAACGSLGLVAGTLGGLLMLAAERVAWHLAGTPATPDVAPIDPARRARRARRRRLLLLGSLAVIVGLGVAGWLTVPVKSLDRAIMDDDVAAVRKHLLWARDANMPNVRGQTALLRAIDHESGQVARMLIGRGVDVNATSDWICPLALAAMRSDEGLVRLLIAKGADVDGPGPMMSPPPLHTAVRFCRVEMVRILLEAGADPNLLDRQGMSPLAVAMKVREVLRREVATAARTEGNAPDEGPDDSEDWPGGQEFLDRLEEIEKTIDLLKQHGANAVSPSQRPTSGPLNESTER